jgi:predicted NBD/HSP70 family sugar kinase/mannose-6-phosphate isomerase class I
MNKKYALGMDVGGSHLATAIVDIASKKIIPETKKIIPINSKDGAKPILEAMAECLAHSLQNFNQPIDGIGISVPGPFDYENGICEIYNCNKYESLYGVDIRTYLGNQLHPKIKNVNDIVFANDASCFLSGEAWVNSLSDTNVAAITLGTGVGSSFMVNGKIIKIGDHIPPNGEVYNLPFKGKRAEDWLGTQWFLSAYKDLFGKETENVKSIAENAPTSEKAEHIFLEFGANLGDFLLPILSSFKAEHLIFGGNICKSFPLFESSFISKFNGNLPKILLASPTEDSAILGAVYQLITKDNSEPKKGHTSQYPMPIITNKETKDSYEVFPNFPISNGAIERSFKSLAKEIVNQKNVLIDGYMGIYWDEFILEITKELKALNKKSIPFSMSSAYKSTKEIDRLITPYLGGDDPVFGRLFDGELKDFFDMEKLERIQEDKDCINILYGTGAFLSNWDGIRIYIDLPKDEIQYRSRAGTVLNLGAALPIPPKLQYKRMFFIDWPVLNRHKACIINQLDYIVDGQYTSDISWCTGETLKLGLQEMSQNAFRARPWFSPGVWGGDWMKDRFDQLNQEVVNYAWSFELIVPENGIVLSKNGICLEVSFDMLMYNDHKAILGNASQTFGYEFPIRFNYLDTYDGENLSLQCHPTPKYVRENFGDKFTQDETYYILDCEPGAEVYLGFKEGVKREEFHHALLKSHEAAKVMDVDKYIQKFLAKKHDLFLIPNGTIHCSGINNMVLEISSTKYLYTFKMYDWMRMDLDGSPRPLNIERGMDNVNFDCIGKRVKEDYISKETIIEEGSNYKTKRLSTHSKHFYELFRFEFNDEIEIATNNQCHILNLVEGSKIKVNTGEKSMIIQYAETFVIPAKTKKYTMINLGSTAAKVVQANIKPEFCNTKL